jgi:hypothetical protein
MIEFIPVVMLIILVIVFALCFNSLRDKSAPEGYSYVVRDGREVLEEKKTIQPETERVEVKSNKPVKFVKSSFAPDILVDIPDDYFKPSPPSVAAARGERIEHGDWYGVYRDLGLSHSEIMDEFPAAKNIGSLKGKYEGQK